MSTPAVLPPGAALVSEHDAYVASIKAVLRDALNAVPPHDAAQLASAVTSAATMVPRHPRETAELALRMVVLDELAAVPENGRDVVRILRIVDCAIELFRRSSVDGSLCCVLLEYIFTFCSQRELREAITAIRDRLVDMGNSGVRKFAPKLKNCGHFAMLKAGLMCVERDRSGGDSAFSGRLRIMLASALPVWDKSGLNINGAYSVGNVTGFAKGSPESEEKVYEEGDGASVDYALHRTFWGLQRFMANPPLAELDPHWTEARTAMESVLAALEVTAVSKDPPPPSLTMRFPKFLTSPSLIRFQLTDAYLRRHVLTQYLIFLHHLNMIGSGLFRATSRDASQERVKFCAELFKSGGEGEALESRVLALLARNDDDKYVPFLSGLLLRERQWVSWKANRCPSLGRSALPTRKSTSGPPRRKRIDVREESDMQSGMSIEKARWQTPTGKKDWELRQDAWQIMTSEERLAALKDPERNVTPSVADFEEMLRADKTGESDEDMKRKNDPKFLWRGVRVLRAQSLSALHAVVKGDSKMGFDLDVILAPKRAAPMAIEQVAAPPSKKRSVEPVTKGAPVTKVVPISKSEAVVEAAPKPNVMALSKKQKAEPNPKAVTKGASATMSLPGTEGITDSKLPPASDAVASSKQQKNEASAKPST